MKVDLSVEIGGIRLSTPVITASGTFGSGQEYSQLIDLKKIGAITTKTITYKPRAGNPPPRICETASGLINSIGLQNKGIEAFLSEDMPFLQDIGIPIFVSIGGNSVSEYCRLAKILSQIEAVSALEVNISCPNVKSGGIIFGQDERQVADLVSQVKASTQLPLIVKLTPQVADIARIAVVAERAGAQAISLINTIPAMAIDVERKKPRLGATTGGLSGPAIRPIAVYLVYQTRKAVSIPIIGMGGISSTQDALEFILAGAQAVAVGTAIFTNPSVLLEITSGMADYLVRHGYQNISELVGSVK